MTASLPPIYSLLANIQIAHARKAPKIVLLDARKPSCHCVLKYLVQSSFFIGQDNMTKEKPKEEYYREAAQFLNTGEKAVAESGEGVGGTLAFLTRGARYIILRSPTILIMHLI
jgi:RNA polymerase-associated protein CTR9